MNNGGGDKGLFCGLGERALSQTNRPRGAPPGCTWPQMQQTSSPTSLLPICKTIEGLVCYDLTVSLSAPLNLSPSHLSAWLLPATRKLQSSRTLRQHHTRSNMSGKAAGGRKGSNQRFHNTAFLKATYAMKFHAAGPNCKRPFAARVRWAEQSVSPPSLVPSRPPSSLIFLDLPSPSLSLVPSPSCPIPPPLPSLVPPLSHHDQVPAFGLALLIDDICS